MWAWARLYIPLPRKLVAILQQGEQKARFQGRVLCLWLAIIPPARKKGDEIRRAVPSDPTEKKVSNLNKFLGLILKPYMGCK